MPDPISMITTRNTPINQLALFSENAFSVNVFTLDYPGQCRIHINICQLIARDGQYLVTCIGDSIAQYFCIGIELFKSIKYWCRFILFSCIPDTKSIGDTF